MDLDFIVDNCWDTSKLLSMLDYDTVSKTKAILIPLSNQEENFVWGPSANGIFSIKFATWLQYNDMCPHPKLSC